MNMSKEIQCPLCANRGEATTDDKGAFAVRGHFQGKAVRKCNKCGAGLFLGWLGRPKPIPSQLWQHMKESWERKFGPEEEKVTSAQVGEALCDIFIDKWKSPDDIKKMRDDFSIMATNTEIYLCLSSLYFMGFIMATKSGNIQIPSPVIMDISHNLASFLIVKYVDFHSVDEDSDVLLQEQNRITQGLIEVWDESMDKKPAPHWYVGKEVCYILNGRDKTPDIALTTMFGGFLSGHAVSIKEFLDGLVEKGVTITN